MEPHRRPLHSSQGVKAAPFAYDRRTAVCDAADTQVEALRATAASPPRHGRNIRGKKQHRPRKQRFQARSFISSNVHVRDMTAAVHERARLSSMEEANLRQAAAVHPQSSGSPFPELPSSPPLLVGPVASCLRPLRYIRSARAWDTIAAGCLIEAKQLSEADNDVVAWAACFILGGEAQKGLLLLESYVIASCVVLYEVHIGELGRPPKGVNPFSHHADTAGGRSRRAAREATTTSSFAQRKCLDRHNEVLLGWMRHRDECDERTPSELAAFDVPVATASKETVRRVVLQSMQLVDAVEVKRWYAVALMLYASHDRVPRSRRVRASSEPAGEKRAAAGKTKDSDGDANDRASDTDSVFSQALSVQRSGGRKEAKAGHTGTPTSVSPHTGGAGARADARDIADGYHAPLNLWFRNFFALTDGSAEGGAAAASPTMPDLAQQSFSPAATEPHSPSSPHAASPGKPKRTDSFTNAQPGKVAQTLSWFKSRVKTARPLSRIDGSPAFYSDEAESPTSAEAAATWRLPTLSSLDQEQTCALLLSHREEWDVYFITAVTAFHTHHYRTCMMAASRFLLWAEAHAAAYEPETSPPMPEKAVPGLQRYQLRFAVFLRAWCALQIGERLQAGKDIVSLLESKEDSLSFHVGCALGLYGMPLPAAKDAVLAATHLITQPNSKSPKKAPPSPVKAATSFSLTVQSFLYLLTEAVHAVTLLQLGLVEPALTVASTTLKVAEMNGLKAHAERLPLGTLRDVVVVAATALEDSSAILDVPLSAHRLVYLAVCPAFFGGLCPRGIRVKKNSATHRILYPRHLLLYASTLQVVPFHMNRAVYLFYAGQLHSAWDDVCCAVAAADELAGSVAFSFSDCFPLRVYHFACRVGFALLEHLLAADLEAAKACLADPLNAKAMVDMDAKLRENELLSKEVMLICRGVVERMRSFYSHSRVTELCRVQTSMLCGGQDYLQRAVALARRYPHHPDSQNLLTIALYFDHHIPEAVDNARKNLQRFPHSSDVIHIHHQLQKKNVTYNFNYRGMLPLRYKPGSLDRVYTKRMVFILILLAANLAVLGVTAYVNAPFIVHFDDSMRYLAVRMQLPTLAPLFFAALFLIHAIVAAATTKNLIATTLMDLHFMNTPLSRALFCLRCIPLVNLVNALLVSISGNNFLFESGSATFVLYFFLAILFVPFTTRIWFLPSIDEPMGGFMTWLAILSIDTVVALVVVIPHIIVGLFEPYMLVLFYFFAPAERPSTEKGFVPPSSSIRRRLLLHAHDSDAMPRRFTVGSGSRFVHIWVLQCLYLWSHSSMETRFLAESQLEAESYRVYPLLEGEEAQALYACVPQTALCVALSSNEEITPTTANRDAKAGARAGLPATHHTPPSTAHRPTAVLSPQCDSASVLPGKHRRETRDLPAHATGNGHATSPSLPAVSDHKLSASPSGSSTSTSASSPASSSLSDSYGSSSYGDSGDDYSSYSTYSSDASDEEVTSGTAMGAEEPHDSGKLSAGVRTVEAMRQMLDRTSRSQSPGMHHAASFVRADTLEQSMLDSFAQDSVEGMIEVESPSEASSEEYETTSLRRQQSATPPLPNGATPAPVNEHRRASAGEMKAVPVPPRTSNDAFPRASPPYNVRQPAPATGDEWLGGTHNAAVSRQSYSFQLPFLRGPPDSRRGTVHPSRDPNMAVGLPADETATASAPAERSYTALATPRGVFAGGAMPRRPPRMEDGPVMASASPSVSLLGMSLPSSLGVLGIPGAAGGSTSPHGTAAASASASEASPFPTSVIASSVEPAEQLDAQYRYFDDVAAQLENTWYSANPNAGNPMPPPSVPPPHYESR